MLQQTKPQDYVISTGLEVSVRQFIEWGFDAYGIQLYWEGEGLNEVGKVKSQVRTDLPLGSTLIKVSEQYFRPSEVDQLLGDSKKARTHCSAA